MKARGRKIIKNTAGFVFAACLIFISLITSVEAVCYYNPGYFEREYEKYDVLSSLPEMTMSETDGLMKVTKHMMDYLRGKEDSLQVIVKMDGEERGFFTEREIAHMEDVRDLFVGAIFLRRAAIVTAAAAIILLAAVSGKRKEALSALSKGMLAATAITALLCASFGLIIAVDFSDAFVTFHHLFFDNDLWILNPYEDMLVNIVPEGFFFDTAARILGLFAGSVAILCALSGMYLFKAGKKSN